MQLLTDLFAKPGFRQAAASFGWLVGERAGRFVFSALVGILVARYLGPARLGALSYGIASVSLIGFLPAMGLDALLKRDILKVPTAAPELMSTVLVVRFGAGLATYLALWLATSVSWFFTPEEAFLFRILGLLAFQPALYLPELWLQVHLHAKRTTLVQLAALALSSLARLWLVVVAAPLAAFAWVIVGEMVLCSAGYIWCSRRLGLRYDLAGGRAATARRLLVEAWPLMFANLAVVVYLRIDEVMLRHLADVTEVGIYSSAVKLSELWYFLPIALGSSVLPALMRAREKGPAAYVERQQQYYDLSVTLSYLLSVPVALGAPLIVRLAYGAEFMAAAPILSVHIWASVFVFLGVARGQWLVNEGLQKFYLAATLSGAVVNILLNFMLIPRWGGLGAAYATVVSYALAGWLASYCHPTVRVAARAQTRALLIPFRAGRYLRRS